MKHAFKCDRKNQDKAKAIWGKYNVMIYLVETLNLFSIYIQQIPG